MDPGILQTYRLVLTGNSASSRYAASGGGIRLSAISWDSAKGSFLSTTLAGNAAWGRTSAIGGGLYCVTQSNNAFTCNMRGLVVRNNSAMAVGPSATQASGTVATTSIYYHHWSIFSLTRACACPAAVHLHQGEAFMSILAREWSSRTS
jgi:hypothetical protein